MNRCKQNMDYFDCKLGDKQRSDASLGLGRKDFKLDLEELQVEDIIGAKMSPFEDSSHFSEYSDSSVSIESDNDSYVFIAPKLLNKKRYPLTNSFLPSDTENDEFRTAEGSPNQERNK